MSLTSANRFELLQMAESVAQEKNIDRGIVLEAMEESMAKAARMRYGQELDIRAKYNKETGDLTMQRVRTVVEEVENLSTEMTLEDARKINPEYQLGSEHIEELPPVGVDQLDRINIQVAKQVIHRKVREAEMEKQYEEFKDKKGQIIVGTVKGVEQGNIIVELSIGETMIHRTQKISHENPEKGTRIRAYVTDVAQETRGPQVKLSRTANEFMRELFRSEVPEFYDGTIDIKCIARDPGSRAKIAVVSYDASIDPVGACVGMRGSRVQTVVNELQGERVDVIPWTENAFEFVTYALQPAKVSKGILDEQGNPTTIVVPDDQLSLAIGRRGQNVRLARSLTGLDIEIVTETYEREQRQEIMNQRQKLFMEAIDVDETFAHLLVTEGFDSIGYLAECTIDELLTLNGIDEAIAEELQNRAQNYVAKENEEILAEARRYGLKDDLAEFEGLTPKMLLELAKNEITTLEDFATLADWELSGGYNEIGGKQVWEKGLLEDFNINAEDALYLIASARVSIGWMKPEDIQAIYGEEDTEAESDQGATEET